MFFFVFLCTIQNTWDFTFSFSQKKKKIFLKCKHLNNLLWKVINIGFPDPLKTCKLQSKQFLISQRKTLIIFKLKKNTLHLQSGLFLEFYFYLSIVQCHFLSFQIPLKAKIKNQLLILNLILFMSNTTSSWYLQLY